MIITLAVDVADADLDATESIATVARCTIAVVTLLARVDDAVAAHGLARAARAEADARAGVIALAAVVRVVLGIDAGVGALREAGRADQHTVAGAVAGLARSADVVAGATVELVGLQVGAGARAVGQSHLARQCAVANAVADLAGRAGVVTGAAVELVGEQVGAGAAARREAHLAGERELPRAVADLAGAAGRAGVFAQTVPRRSAETPARERVDAGAAAHEGAGLAGQGAVARAVADLPGPADRSGARGLTVAAGAAVVVVGQGIDADAVAFDKARLTRDRAGAGAIADLPFLAGDSGVGAEAVARGPAMVTARQGVKAGAATKHTARLTAWRTGPTAVADLARGARFARVGTFTVSARTAETAIKPWIDTLSVTGDLAGRARKDADTAAVAGFACFACAAAVCAEAIAGGAAVLLVGERVHAPAIAAHLARRTGRFPRATPTSARRQQCRGNGGRTPSKPQASDVDHRPPDLSNWLRPPSTTWLS